MICHVIVQLMVRVSGSLPLSQSRERVNLYTHTADLYQMLISPSPSASSSADCYKTPFLFPHVTTFVPST